MNTLEDYKAALLERASPYLRKQLMPQADADGFTAWELAELSMVRAEPWA